MIEIKSMTVSKPFRYLWLKSVEGVDLSQHCAKCIIGEYDDRVSARVRQLDDVTLTESVYYLCGVALPYKWENNFHLAFRHKEGSTLTYESNGVAVVIENAERIFFSGLDIDTSLPQAHKKAFCTCRNWQFANWLEKFDSNCQ